jgi:hypothetical protein
MLAVRRQLCAEKVAAENASRLLEDTMLQRQPEQKKDKPAQNVQVSGGGRGNKGGIRDAARSLPIKGDFPSF